MLVFPARDRVVSSVGISVRGPRFQPVFHLSSDEFNDHDGPRRVGTHPLSKTSRPTKVIIESEVMKSLVIVPTYEEVNNINPLVEGIFAATSVVHVLFVDDASPDGTQDLLHRWQGRCPERIHVMARAGKLGLGTAYIAGFRWGLRHGYDRFIEMDADLSHDPQALPEMLSRLRSYEVVIGSRYVPGGRVMNWGLWRRVLSRGGNLYARTLLGVKVHDLTGGFTGWRRQVIEGIGLERIASEGYAFQIELKYRALQMGFTWIEIPITFTERRVGQSKMSWRIMLEAMVRVWRLALRPSCGRRSRPEDV